MKKQKCVLLWHGKIDQHNMGEFESVAAARRYANNCDLRNYTIIKIK